MHVDAGPMLHADEIDDLLYFTRVNEASDLQASITDLAQKYSCDARAIISACTDAENGNTMLHYCSANGLPEFLKTLMLQLQGKTQEAVQDGTSRSESFLNQQNREGNTPLHWAAYNGHLDVVKLLLAGGADMWVKNAAGHLAMFEAERADKPEVVQHLLEVGGSKVERAGREGQLTAEDVADVQGGAEDGENGHANPDGDVEMAGTGSSD